MQQNFVIRNVEANEMNAFIDFAFSQGWNQSNYDAEYYYRADPNGFFAGELDGKMIAIISAVHYQTKVGFISFFIVKSEYRKNGFGKKMFTHAMNYLEGCNVGLDATTNLVSFYKSMGFKQYCKTYVLSGVAVDKAPADPKIVKLSEVPIQKVLQYEQKVSPYSRQTFLKEYIQMPQSKTAAYYDGDILKGYGVLKKCPKQSRIYPLYADSQQIALKLINALRGLPPNDTQILINVQTMNQKAIQLCKELDMKVTLQLARMYTKELPDINYSNVFGILSSDIG